MTYNKSFGWHPVFPAKRDFILFVSIMVWCCCISYMNIGWCQLSLEQRTFVVPCFEVTTRSSKYKSFSSSLCVNCSLLRQMKWTANDKIVLILINFFIWLLYLVLIFQFELEYFVWYGKPSFQMRVFIIFNKNMLNVWYLIVIKPRMGFLFSPFFK